MMTFSPASRNDIIEFYGSVRETLKVICAKRDGKVVGVVGLAVGKEQSRFFSEYKDMSCKELCQAYRAVKMAMRYVKESRRPVVSIAEHDLGRKNLLRLGFKHVEDSIFVWVQ